MDYFVRIKEVNEKNGGEFEKTKKGGRASGPLKHENSICGDVK